MTWSWAEHNDYALETSKWASDKRKEHTGMNQGERKSWIDGYGMDVA